MGILDRRRPHFLTQTTVDDLLSLWSRCYVHCVARNAGSPLHHRILEQGDVPHVEGEQRDEEGQCELANAGRGGEPIVDGDAGF